MLALPAPCEPVVDDILLDDDVSELELLLAELFVDDVDEDDEDDDDDDDDAELLDLSAVLVVFSCEINADCD